jgi:putative ABC transport system permease protein
MYRDFVFALRQLRTNLKFSLIIILTLALGIGATTAIFSVVSGVLLRALPFPEPDRLISLQTLVFPRGESASQNASAGTPDDVSFPDFFDWRSRNRALEAIASYAYGTTRKFTPAGNEPPTMVEVEYVSADFLRVLGVAPALGRSFVPADETDANRPIILSHQFWESEFHSSPDIIGKHIAVSDRLATVIGVMPEGFSFPNLSQPPSFWGTFWRASSADIKAIGNPWKESVSVEAERSNRTTQVIGRLKRGASLEQTRAEMNALQQSLAEQYPDDRNAAGVALQPLLDHLSGDFRRPLYVLFGAVTALLLIACANVAGLLLARGFARRSEFDVRVALGARPAHLVRQVMMESTVLAICAGVLGVALAFVLLKTFLIFAPLDLSRLTHVRIDGMVLGFAFLVSLTTGIGFGVFPAWSASRLRSSSGLRSAGRGISGGHHEHRLWGMLVIVETAVSLILLAGSGLLIRSFLQTMQVAPGFDPHHVLALRLGMSPVEYPEGKATLFFRQLMSRLSAIPGVESVSSAYPIPFPYDLTSRFSIAGRPADPGDMPVANRATVGPRYFETLRIPLLQGRTFDSRDDQNAKRVAIVNQQFAQEFFPTEDPLGKSIQPDFLEYGYQPTWFEIVGVVASIRTTDLTESPKPQFYLPYEQASHWTQWVLMRVYGEPQTYLNSARVAVAELNRDLPVFAVTTFDELIAQSTVFARFEAGLLTCFAVSALLLAAVGLYAALSEMVARRNFEIGLRVALGAQYGDVFALVLRRGLVLAAIGLTLGFLGFVIFGRVLADMLYGVGALDPITVAAAGVVLLLVSFLASAAPAWRAARLEPTEALREQ